MLGSAAGKRPESARPVWEASDAVGATLPHISQLVNEQLDAITGDGGGDDEMSVTLELLEQLEATPGDEVDDGAKWSFGDL